MQVSYTLSTDEDGVQIFFDDEASEEGGSLSGTTTIAQLETKEIGLRCSSRGQIEDDDGVLTVDISEANAVDQDFTVSGFVRQTYFKCGDPPKGSVNIQGPIFVDDAEIMVNWTFEETEDDNAYLLVDNRDESAEWSDTLTTDDGEVTIDVTDVGGISDGDRIRARLFEQFENGETINRLADDQVTVSDPDEAADQVNAQTGTLLIEDGGRQLLFDIYAREEVDVDAITVDYDDGEFDGRTKEIDGQVLPVTFDGTAQVELFEFDNDRLDNRGNRDFDPEFVEDSSLGNIDVTFTFADSSELVVHINAPTR